VVSYVPDGVALGEWVADTATGVTAFYDIDTPVTLAKLSGAGADYITPSLISRYDIYLSFTGGAVLSYLERHYGSPAARALYCSVDPQLYFPEATRSRWDLGYMGTYSADRQFRLERLLLQPAQQAPELRMVVAGPMYPRSTVWPESVIHLDHVPPTGHCAFYNQQRFTLNLTRADMIEAGYSPSVRLFEAAACATPIISDYWEGLETFFEIGTEILVAETAGEVLAILRRTHEEERRALGERARRRVLHRDTAEQRAVELESYFFEARERSAEKRCIGAAT
jgi:spore maturation protein CgeB